MEFLKSCVPSVPPYAMLSTYVNTSVCSSEETSFRWDILVQHDTASTGALTKNCDPRIITIEKVDILLHPL